MAVCKKCQDTQPGYHLEGTACILNVGWRDEPWYWYVAGLLAMVVAAALVGMLCVKKRRAGGKFDSLGNSHELRQSLFEDGFATEVTAPRPHPLSRDRR
jgi:hypothetical protein